MKNMSSNTVAFDVELRTILSHHPLLRVLLKNRYRVAQWAIVLVIVYWLVGMVIAIANGVFIPYLTSRYMYVVMLAFVVSITAASWYPQVLLEVLLVIPETFDVAPHVIKAKVEQWLRYIRLRVLLIGGGILATMAVTESLLREIYAWSTVGLPPPWGGVTVHFQILVAICGVIFGSGVIVWLSTLRLLDQLFRFRLRLFRYRHLYPLSTLSTGMTIACVLAVALFILLIFGEVDIATVIVACAGMGFAIIVFMLPQLSYQRAVAHAKREYLNKLGMMYEYYYKITDKIPFELQQLTETKTGLESLATLENSVKTAPVWLFAISDVIRVLLSLLTPLGSILINALLSKSP